MHKLPEVLARRGVPMQDAIEAAKELFDAVGVAELAERAGVKPDTVLKWRMRHEDFPKPFDELKMGPLWFWPDVEPWVSAQLARKPGPKAKGQ